MPIPAEIDELVLQLASSLAPSQYHAFIAAARTALAGIPCIGPGSAYRVLVPLQRRFFDPPADNRALAGPRHFTPNRLNSLPAIGIAEDPQGATRRRTMWARG
jgi:hypothetical protein